jgi:hypothetical protein
MRIEIHVTTLDEADEVRARYAASSDEIVIIVAQPVASSPAEKQDRKSAGSIV